MKWVSCSAPLKLPAEDDETKEARLGCSDIFAGLAIHQKEAASLKILDRMIARPIDYHRELGRIIFMLSGYFHDDKRTFGRPPSPCLGAFWNPTSPPRMFSMRASPPHRINGNRRIENYTARF